MQCTIVSELQDRLADDEVCLHFTPSPLTVCRCTFKPLSPHCPALYCTAPCVYARMCVCCVLLSAAQMFCCDSL